MITSSLCFLNLSIKNCQRQPAALKLCRLIVHLKFYKICKFQSHVTRNKVIMMSLTKTMENKWKMRTSAEPNKIYIGGKVLMRAIQKCNLLLNLSHCVKSYRHLCQIYQNHSPSMVTSRDPGFKF